MRRSENIHQVIADLDLNPNGMYFIPSTPKSKKFFEALDQKLREKKDHLSKLYKQRGIKLGDRNLHRKIFPDGPCHMQPAKYLSAARGLTKKVRFKAVVLFTFCINLDGDIEVLADIIRERKVPSKKGRKKELIVCHPAQRFNIYTALVDALASSEAKEVVAILKAGDFLNQTGTILLKNALWKGIKLYILLIGESEPETYLKRHATTLSKILQEANPLNGALKVSLCREEKVDFEMVVIDWRNLNASNLFFACGIKTKTIIQVPNKGELSTAVADDLVDILPESTPMSPELAASVEEWMEAIPKRD